MSPFSPQRMSSSDPRLKEWKEALTNARSFNTLLLQLRGFGIPIVITIMGGGVAFASNIEIPNVRVKYAQFGLAGISVFLSVAVFLIRATLGQWGIRKSPPPSPKTALWWFEMVELCGLAALPVTMLLLTLLVWPEQAFDSSFFITNPAVIGIVLFGLLLLFGLYGIDRCYYYRLLIGAVVRADTIEQDLGFYLTAAVSNETPGEHSKTLITTMYCLPAFGAIVAVVVLTYLRLWTNVHGTAAPSLLKCVTDALR